jgi:small multidrug resistance pump
MITYIYLFLAIIAELIGTNFLKFTDGFTKLLPTVISLAAYAISFYLLSLIVKHLPVNIVYAIWSGIGIIVMTIISVYVFKNPINLPTLFGILLITIGVVLVNLFGM